MAKTKHSTARSHSRPMATEAAKELPAAAFLAECESILKQLTQMAQAPATLLKPRRGSTLLWLIGHVHVLIAEQKRNGLTVVPSMGDRLYALYQAMIVCRNSWLPNNRNEED